jgi:hypothetical protein
MNVKSGCHRVLSASVSHASHSKPIAHYTFTTGGYHSIASVCGLIRLPVYSYHLGDQVGMDVSIYNWQPLHAVSRKWKSWRRPEGGGIYSGMGGDRDR